MNYPANGDKRPEDGKHGEDETAAGV